MEDAPVQRPVPAEPHRPKTLGVLCILTFIWSGLNLASGIIIGSDFGPVIQLAKSWAERNDMPGMEILDSLSPAFFFVSALFSAGSLAGALAMRNLRKVGFHIYTVAQILLIITPMYFFKLAGPSLFDVLTSGLFIMLYSRYLKIMS